MSSRRDGTTPDADTVVSEPVLPGSAQATSGPAAEGGLLGDGRLADDTVTEPDGYVAAPAARDDDLGAALAAAAPKRWWDRGTVVLAAALLVLAGFLGGVQVQKRFGPSPAAGPNGAGAGLAGRFNGATGGFNGAGTGGARGTTGGGADPAAAPGGAAAGSTTGTVKLVDGTTVYVQTADGTVVTVRTSGRTTVRAARPGSVKDIKAGDTVTVTGGAGTDGNVQATSVTTEKAK